MSEFKGLYKDECEVLPLIQERPNICPVCIPDLGAPYIDWLTTRDPYFDPRTCEYIYNYLAPVRAFEIDREVEDLEQLVERVKIFGAIEIFKFFAREIPNYEEDPDAIDKIITNMERVHVDASYMIRIRVSLNASYFEIQEQLDSVPQNPNQEAPTLSPDPTLQVPITNILENDLLGANQEAEEAPVDPNLPTEIIIDDLRQDYNLNLITIRVGLEGYKLNHETWMLTEGALLTVVTGTQQTFVPFKYDKLITEFTSFRKKLDKFIERNGYKLTNFGNLFSFDKIATMVRIELDNTDPDNVLKVSKVFAAFEGCPEQELVIGLDSFIQDTSSLKAGIFFFANMKDVFADVTAPTPVDWLDFTQKYVYPTVEPNYGDKTEEPKKRDSACDIAIGDLFENALKNLLKDIKVSSWDMVARQLELNSCDPDPKKSDPNLKEFDYFNPRKQRDAAAKYSERIKKLKDSETYKRKMAYFDQPVKRLSGATDEQYQEAIELKKKRKKEYLESVEKQARDEAEQFVKEQDKDFRYNLGLFEDEWSRQTKARFESDKSIFEIFKNSMKDLETSSDEGIGQAFLNFVGLCGVNEGMQKAANCLMKQVPFDQVIQSALKVGLELIPGEFEIGIGAVKEAEIKQKVMQKVGKDFENFPWPWKFPRNNQQLKQRYEAKKAVEQQFRDSFQQELKSEGALRDAEYQTERNLFGSPTGDKKTAAQIFEERYNKRVEELQATYNSVFDNLEDGSAESIAATLQFVTDEEKKDIKEELYEELFKELHGTQLKEMQHAVTARENNEITTAINEIGGEIIAAYVEVLADTFSIDELLEIFESVPTIQVILSTLLSLSQLNCPTKVWQDLQMPHIKSFKLDICDPTKPIIPYNIPKIEFTKSPLTVIANNFVKAVRSAIQKIISYMIKILLDFMEDLLCKLFDFVGGLATDLLSGRGLGTLENTLKKAFCPNATDEQAKNMINELLNNIGLQDGEIQNAVDCLGGALAGSFTQRELAQLLVEPDPPEELIARVADAIMIGCPRFANILGNPDGVRNMFGNLSDYLSDEARDRVSEFLDYLEDLPLYDTICLTSEDLERWDNIRRGNLEAAGLTGNEAQQQIENYNRRAREALEDLLRNLADGPNGNGLQEALIKAINDLLSPNGYDPCNVLENGESAFGSGAFREPSELVILQDQLSNTILNDIEEVFIRNFARGPMWIEPYNSFLSRIMRDSEDKNYTEHNFLEGNFFSRMNYHHSETSKGIKEGASIWTKSFLSNDFAPFSDGDKGYFPDTIGSYLQTSLLEDLEYVSTTLTIPQVDITGPMIPLPDYSYNFDMTEDINYEGTIAYNSDVYENLENENTRLNYRIRLRQNRPVMPSLNHEELIEIEPEIKTMLQGYEITEQKAKRQIFSQFIQSRIEELSEKPEIDYEALYDKVCEKTFNIIKKISIEDSDGFKFGWEDDEIVPGSSELTYVGPNGETPYEDFFSEQEKVLGRAETPSDRVFFLDPERFGGSYTTPPVYIYPKEMHGWKRIFEVMAPDEEGCDPKTEGILKMSEIKELANKVRNNTNLDPRMKNTVQTCFLEKPFDKILSKNAAGSVDAISRMHLRMSIAVCMSTSMPVLTNIRFNNENYDDTFSEIVYQRLFDDLSNVNPFIPGLRKIRQTRYAMLVFEQLIQSFEREIISPLPEGDVNGKDISSLDQSIQDAYTKINKIREDYDFNIIDPSLNNLIWEFGDFPSLKNLPHDVTAKIGTSGTFFIYAMAYSHFGEELFEKDFNFTYSGHSLIPLVNPPTPFLPFTDWKLFCKILAIRMALPEMRVIIKDMIKREVISVMDHFYSSISPKIDNVKMNLFTNPTMFYNTKFMNLGTTNYKKAREIGSVIEVGEAEDVLEDIEEETPWDGSQPEEVLFKVEQYVRFIEKDDTHADVSSRPLSEKGVVSIQKAQDIIDILKEDHGDKHVSELFGDAELAEDGLSYTGSIGIKYGLRMVMKVPRSLMDSTQAQEIISANDRLLSISEKAFFTNLQQGAFFEAENFSIPICSVEMETKDNTLDEINMLEGVYRYDVECLLKDLVETKEYKMLFEYLVPTKAATSFSLASCYSFLMQSVGKSDTRSDGDLFKSRKEEDLDSFFLADANHTCRKYFVSFYESTRFLYQSDIGGGEFRLPKIDLPDLWALLFGFDWIPNWKLEIDINLPDLGFPHKIIKKNPFNKNKELCESEVDKLFK